NGIFDSKVLSQKHAKIWCEGNQVLIKDLDSSNGTVVNDYPLVAGEVFELETDDIIEFGIDLTLTEVCMAHLIFNTNVNSIVEYSKVSCFARILETPDVTFVNKPIKLEMAEASGQREMLCLSLR
ncbi:hypothetical protein BC829DRAFT_361216, partial [Chytridium lagenaria]